MLDRANDYIGVATNNTAEYRALLLGLERARELGAREVEVVNDSQLVARQVTGEYRVKKDDLRPLHAQALAALRHFDRWSIRSVPREQNEHADDLVNEAIDARRRATAVGRRGGSRPKYGARLESIVGEQGAGYTLQPMASNDPTETGGLFIGRRPGTAPLRYSKRPGAPARACAGASTPCWQGRSWSWRRSCARRCGGRSRPPGCGSGHASFTRRTRSAWRS